MAPKHQNDSHPRQGELPIGNHQLPLEESYVRQATSYHPVHILNVVIIGNMEVNIGTPPPSKPSPLGLIIRTMGYLADLITLAQFFKEPALWAFRTCVQIITTLDPDPLLLALLVISNTAQPILQFLVVIRVFTVIWNIVRSTSRK